MNTAQARKIALDAVLDPEWRSEIEAGFRCPVHPDVVFSYYGTMMQSCDKCDEARLAGLLPVERALEIPMDLVYSV